MCRAVAPVRYTELVSHHCSSDALRLMMPPLLAHEDASKRNTITSLLNTFRPRKQELDKEAEAKGASPVLHFIKVAFSVNLLSAPLSRCGFLCALFVAVAAGVP